MANRVPTKKYVYVQNEEKLAKMQALLQLLNAGFRNNDEASMMIEASVTIVNDPAKYEGSQEWETAQNMVKFAQAAGLVQLA